jgi:glutathione S-transferase
MGKIHWFTSRYFILSGERLKVRFGFPPSCDFLKRADARSVAVDLPFIVRLLGVTAKSTRSNHMIPTITAFEHSPDRGQGLARDTRVRWALEEVGQSYEVRLVSFRAMKEPAHLALHPFGQIPTYEESDLALFESGAIIFHIAERYPVLLPSDSNARARAVTWMFASVNTVEPPILELANAKLLESNKPWSRERLPLVEERVRDRLKQLSAYLGNADWLDGAFSAADLMMVSVLLRLRSSGILDEYPNLSAYVARGEARPAYKRAFAAQMAVFTGSESRRGTADA